MNDLSVLLDLAIIIGLAIPIVALAIASACRPSSGFSWSGLSSAHTALR